MKSRYPFTALVGQETMKLALVLNAINPANIERTISSVVQTVRLVGGDRTSGSDFGWLGTSSG